MRGSLRNRTALARSHPNLPSPPVRTWAIAGVCGALALLVWAVFGQTLGHDFVNYDDDRLVYANPLVSRGLSGAAVREVFVRPLEGEWWPLTTLSHLLVWAWCGACPRGHHLVNVVLHGLTAIVLFLAWQRMTGALWPSAWVAAVFAAHPLRVESVAWVAERKDVLSGLFFALLLVAYERYARHRDEDGWPGRRVGDYGLVAVAFALGLLSKTMLVTAPLVLLLLDYWPLERIRLADPGAAAVWRQLQARVREKLPWLAMSVAAAVATWWAQTENRQLVEAIPFGFRVGNALVACATYLGQTVWPVGLAVLYPHPGRDLAGEKVAVALLVGLVITAVALVNWRKRPYLVVGWLWYVGMLVPVIGLVQVGLQAHADRYTYLPQIGLGLMVAWGARELTRGWRVPPAAIGAVGLGTVIALAVVAHRQTAHWRNSLTLWRHTLEVRPNNPFAHFCYANALRDAGQTHAAVRHYALALAQAESFPDAHNNLAVVLAGLGKVEEAVAHWERALALDPENAQACNNLANAHAMRGRFEPALPLYERALQLDPRNPVTLKNYGLVLAAMGQREEAVARWEQALRLAAAGADRELEAELQQLLQGSRAVPSPPLER